MKQLAKIADEKWKAKQSYVDSPILTEAQKRQLASIKGDQRKAPEPRAASPSTSTSQYAAQAARSEDAEKEKEAEGKTEEPEVMLRGEKVDNPFARNRPSAPSETWQPEAWSPAPKRK